jgi:glycosyltransferase involved in cell wall biosynthesis
MQITVITSWFTDVSGGSGTAVFFQAFLEGLRERNYDVAVVSPRLTAEDYVNITLQRFLFNSELRGNPQIENADVLIGFDYDGYALDPHQRPPMIASAHAVYGDIIRWESEPVRTMVECQAFFDGVAMRRADRITCGSQYAKDRIVALYQVDPANIVVIPHGMLKASWLSLVDAEPRAQNDHPVILSVGKMYPRKRIDVLLRAMPTLIARYPTLELRVVGDGLEWDRLHALSAELGIDDHVTWLAYVADEPAFAREWRQADIFCHPSCQETFGYVYLEAMTVGKPIVAARAGAAPEVLGDAALLVEPESPQALADALNRFLENEALRQQYAQRARLRAPLYTQKRMIDGYASLIDELTAHESRGQQRHTAPAS